jgi:hypothetical protein
LDQKASYTVFQKGHFFMAICHGHELSLQSAMKQSHNMPTNRPANSRRHLTVIAALLCAVFTLQAPSPAVALTPPVRTLPSYIKRIYIREFKNNSRIFGVQADLTLFVNDEFMLDGRLDVVQNERSDVRLEGKIKFINEEPTGLSSDEFPLISIVHMETVVELWDPYDPDRLVPLFRFVVPTTIQYVSDPRRSIAETTTEARERLLRQAARDIVNTVMAGIPRPETPLEQKTIERYQQRRGPQKYDPVVPAPRYPVPTPAARRNIERAD